MDLKELSTIERKVKNILERVPEARSNDRLLIELYLFTYHGITTFKQYRNDLEAPPSDTITRMRRKLQKLGRCLPVETVADGRYENEAVCGKYFGK